MIKDLKINSDLLHKSLSAIEGMPILVVGDVMLDRYIFGSVDRISPEAPVPVVQVRKMEDRLGGAANVVKNLRSIRAEVTLAGIVGKDEEGGRVIELLKADGVNCEGIFEDNFLPTTVKTRVIAQQQQIVRIDKELIPNEDVLDNSLIQSKLSNWIEKEYNKYAAVIVSDYGKGAISKLLLNTLSKLQNANVHKNDKIPLIIDPHPAHYLIYNGMTVAKPNRKEAELATGIKIKDRSSASNAAHLLLERWHAEMMLISLGEDGLIIARAGDRNDIFLETVARQVSDVSGAGDTVTAVFSAALAAKSNPIIAGTLANIAAGIVVSQVGTVPVDLSKLRIEIDKF